MAERRLLVSAAVLAGGQSRRMGQNKAFLRRPDGRLFIEAVLACLEVVSDDRLVVAGDLAPYAGLPARLVADRFPGQGPLAGVHAALRAARHRWCLVVACDLPWLEPGVLRALVGAPRPAGVWAVVPRLGGRPLPVVGLYHRRCARVAERLLGSGQRRLGDLLQAVPVLFLDDDWWRRHDPTGRALCDVDTPADLAALWEGRPG